METDQAGASYDVVIIGCGMAGLAAGIRLAMFDRRVLILEKHYAPGGLNSYYSIAGRRFDVGLHAVTNYASADAKGTPLSILLRQLRLPREAFELAPQAGSRIAFPGVDLRFDNGFSLLEAEVARVFPGQVDGFRRLRQTVLEAQVTDGTGAGPSAREVLGRHVTDPLLVEMILCPLMYYGSSTEHDMPFNLFATLWKSVFEEGFGRPPGGIRTIIRALLERFRELGGERRMGCGVRRIVAEGDRASGVELEDGRFIAARQVISTAGSGETRLLCGADPRDAAILANIGRLSFTESITVLDRQPADLGTAETIVFFNDSGRFHYAQASTAVDLRSGVICFPNNYRYPDGQSLPEGLLRVTCIASHDLWTGFAEHKYREEKQRWLPRMLDSALRFLPGLDGASLRQHTVFADMFTPRTIVKYTGHLGGAVYGAARKVPDGRTHLENLFLAGTDQGLLGIVGAMFSGVAMANRHILAANR